MRIRIEHHPESASANQADDAPRARPLTHHEILALMGPFTAAGLHADLAASQRAERRLLLKPREHPPTDDLPLRLTERLALDLPESGRPRLVRLVQDESGLSSELVGEGDDIPMLLEQIQAVPVRRQIRLHAGIAVARSYLIEPPPDAKGGRGGTAAVVITDSRARLHGMVVEMKADRFISHAVDLRLTPEPGLTLKIPEDLTAVIGWHWRPLRELVTLWRGSFRVRSKEPQRTADIERKAERTIAHLVETLAQPPADFHPRYKRARWRASFQRSIPLDIGLILIALMPGINWLDLDDDSILRMLIFHAPPFMLAAMFMMREMPRLEIPPIPRPLRGETWVTPIAKKTAPAA